MMSSALRLQAFTCGNVFSLTPLSVTAFGNYSNLSGNNGHNLSKGRVNVIITPNRQHFNRNDCTRQVELMNRYYGLGLNNFKFIVLGMVQTKEEKRIKKNEKQKRWREKIKRDAVKLETYRAKQNEYARKSRAKRRAILEKNPALLKEERKKNREKCANYRKKIKSTHVEKEPPVRMNIRNRNKQVRKRKIQSLNESIDEWKNKFNNSEKRNRKLEKRIQRMKCAKPTSSPDSPRRLADKLLTKSRAEIRKDLMILYSTVRACKPFIRSRNARISLQILKKYKLKSRGMKALKTKVLNRPLKKRPLVNINSKIKAVREFYERDDNSIATSGKKETITRKGIKKQKRIVTQTLQFLHLKYTAENPKYKISYSEFCKLRPFWVVQSKASDRNTCLCEKCDNFSLLCERMRSLGLINTVSSHALVETIVCTSSRKCLLGKCVDCVGKKVDVAKPNLTNNFTWYYEWVKESKNIMLKTTNKEKIVQEYVKRKHVVEISVLEEKFHHQLRHVIMPHHAKVINQYKAISKATDSVNLHTAVIRVDFSENYACKWAKEIQSVHFGGSRKQVS